MLGAKKEQLETGSGAHKIERIRLATGVADPRLQKRDLKRRRRRAQRLDHLREAVSGLFNIHVFSGCRFDPNRVLSSLVIGDLGFLLLNFEHFLQGLQLCFGMNYWSATIQTERPR